jgi:hypothetical protein
MSLAGQQRSFDARHGCDAETSWLDAVIGPWPAFRFAWASWRMEHGRKRGRGTAKARKEG